MLNELSKCINKQVDITLVNGKEKQGTIVSIDAESNIIRLRDEANNSISILISMIGMLEPSYATKPINKKQIPQSEKDDNDQAQIKSEPEPEPVFDNSNEQIDDNYEILQKLITIEATFDSEIKNSILKITKPSFKTPSDILSLDAHSRIDALKKWNWIKDKHDYAVKIGRLAPNSDELKAIIEKAKSFNQNSKLSNSYVMRSYLGYFNYLNNDKTESVKAFMEAAKLSDKPQEWLNLASVASEKTENMTACYALEKFYLQIDCTKSQYEKAWYRFTELIIKYSVFKSFGNILDSNTFRLPLKEEQQKIFETICYCLIKNNQQEIAKTQLQNSVGNSDYKKLSLECLEVLPQYPISSYDSFKHNFERISVKIDIVKPKVPFIPSYMPKEYVKKKYVNLLTEARTARDSAKNYDKAKELFIQGIEKEQDLNIKERAVRDLASMLAQQMNQPERAIQVITEYQTRLSEPDYNLLYNFYYQSGEYKEAIKIQKKLFPNTQQKDAKVTRYFNMAACYLKLNNYIYAEKNYRNAFNLNTHYTIERNIAVCLYKQGKIDDAKYILKRLVKNFNDFKSLELLDNFKNRNNIRIDDIIIDTAGLVFENLDNFIKFYLSSCDWKYVDKNRLAEGKYIGNDKDRRFDIKKLEDTASTLRSKIAEERSNIYLNAASIFYDLGEKTNDFYKYLCRCFASKGDNSVQSGHSSDTIKTYYLTALKVYDALYFDDEQNRARKYDEQDAINALCRFLYSSLGRDRIPLTAGPKNLSIKESIVSVFCQHPEPSKIFDDLRLIFARSPQYSINRILKIIYENNDLKKIAVYYLKSGADINLDSFIDLWKDKAREIIKIENELSEKLSLLRKFEITEVWLHSGIERIKRVESQVLFESDKDYLIELQKLFDLCISLCKGHSFDEKINKCDDVKQKAKIFIEKIKKNPTKLSIEEVYPIINNLLSTLEDYLNNLYQTSKPELAISSAFASYHLKAINQIDLQVKIENTAEGHAEQVELIIENNNDFYELPNPYSIAYGTIRGNDNETQIIVLQLNPEVVAAKAFTFNAYAVFRTRQGKDIKTVSQELPIQLGNAKDFSEIKPNPYAQWVRGGTVVDKSMFFGRKEFIERAYSAICNNYRSYVIYGQFRSGKSSILHHLEQKLKNNPQMMVAEVGDVGRLMDDNSPTPLLYQMLFGILRRIHRSIHNKERTGLPELDFSIPTSLEFYSHPAPLDLFYEFFDNFNEKRNTYSEWKDIRIIVTMDEFTYLYEKIVQGKLSQDFMKNWKALLAENYFNVVLVAQDVFPKFRNKYDNAFQTMEHERVTYLDEPDAKALIDKPISVVTGESRYTEETAIDRIIELTARSPYYIQIFCNQLVDYINNEKQPYITKANVNIVKDRLLRGDERLDKTAFTNLINDGDPSPDAIPHSDLIKVLIKIAEHTKNDPYCARNKISCKTQSDINKILMDLEERDVIEKHGDKGFRIRVGLFKEWLNENPGFLE